MGGLDAGGGGGGVGQRLDVGDLGLLLGRQVDARGDDGLHDAGRGDEAVLHGGAQSEDGATRDDDDEE